MLNVQTSTYELHLHELCVTSRGDVLHIWGLLLISARDANTGGAGPFIT